ncbi:MAG: hypothetical protein ACPGES_04775 [Coraliomargarita sp.]
MITVEKKKQFNPMLMKVIIVSVGLHVVAGFVATVITIANVVIKEEAQFEEPPVVEQEEPPPEVKVEIKPQTPQQQNMQQQLKMRPVANIAVAQVDVNLPSMEQSFTVSAGLGGVGGGNLLGGARGSLGLGMSDVNVFGLKTRAERILFVIDANRQMLTDKKGGLNSYQVIKDEITDMVGNLSAGTLFNVMLQDRRRVMMFKPQLVPAGSEVHQQLVQWISQVNSDANKLGLEGNPAAKLPQLTAMPEAQMQKILAFSGHHANETGFLTQVTLEQNADAIFFITGNHRGFDNMIAPPTDKQLQEFEKLKATKEYQEQLAKHNLEVAQMEKRVDAELARQNAERAQKGQPPRVLTRRHGVYSNASELGLTWKTRHPGHGPERNHVESKDVVKYFKQVLARLYTDYDKTPPSVNVVLFLAGDEVYRPEWKAQLDAYVRFFKGKNRIIRGEDEIKSARSSKDTANN